MLDGIQAFGMFLIVMVMIGVITLLISEISKLLDRTSEDKFKEIIDMYEGKIEDKEEKSKFE